MNALTIDYKPVGNNGTAQLTAWVGDALLAVEKVDLLRPKQRDAFAAKLCEHNGSIDRAALDAKLLRLAGDMAAMPTAVPVGDAYEVESASIVRAELFHTADVSGLAVPVRSSFGGEARAKWYIYLRRHGDGKRERRELTSAIELPGGARLLVHPVPGDPSPTTTPAWSASARRAWLDGADAPDPSDVFKRISERIAYFLDFSLDAAPATTATLALWSIFTYLYSLWSASPYVRVGGPKGSGKTTLLDVLAEIVFRPVKSMSTSASALFRELHEGGGVFLYDEAERLRDSTPDVTELRAILNGGYKRGCTVSRSEPLGDGKFRAVRFNVYGPKVVAGIAALPETLADRCIPIMMFRSGPDSPKPRRRIDENPAAWQTIRDDLHALALEHGPKWLALSRRSDVVPASLAGRDYELWQPLLALAAWLEENGARGLVAMMQTHAEETTTEGREDSTPEPDEALLRILAEAVTEGRHYTTKVGDVLKRAMELEPAMFAKWSARGVTAALSRYGLRTNKSHGVKVYGRVTLATLRRIEAAYGVDLCLPPETCPNVPQAPPDGLSEAECGAVGVHGVHQGTLPANTSLDDDPDSDPDDSFEEQKRAVGIDRDKAHADKGLSR